MSTSEVVPEVAETVPEAPETASDAGGAMMQADGARGVRRTAKVAHLRSRLPNADDAGLTGQLSLMAGRGRLRLIGALDIVEELCVGDLTLALDVSEDSVSYALRPLRTAGLVRNRTDGRVVLNRGQRLYFVVAGSFPAAADRAHPHRRQRIRNLATPKTMAERIDSVERTVQGSSVYLTRPRRPVSPRPCSQRTRS